MINVVDVARPGFVPGYGTRLFACPNPHEQIARMGTSALFAGLSPLECSDILSRARTKTFARYETLCSQGQPAHNLIWIQTGRVKLSQVTTDGNEVILWVNGFGDAVDVHGDTVDGSHTCSARAMERCQTLVWEYSSFRALAARYPQINANIAKIMAARLCELEERFCEIASHRVADRLALLLLRLAKSVGKQGRAGVELKLGRRDLAQMTGTTVCTVSRILSTWDQLGFVVSRRGGIVISKPERLRQSADPGGADLPQYGGRQI